MLQSAPCRRSMVGGLALKPNTAAFQKVNTNRLVAELLETRTANRKERL